MSVMIASDRSTAVLGLGVTGWSCVRYLAARGELFAVFDSNMSEEEAEDFRRQYPAVPLHRGVFEAEHLRHYQCLMVSPGISLEQPAIQSALTAGAELVSDIDLWRGQVDRPVAAITGSNGKTTVTTMLGLMVEAAGLRAGVGGNIGTPVLDLIAVDKPECDVYIVELSSFQLERSGPLGARVATVLNVSEDHMDRYPDLMRYQQVKQTIYRGCAVAVYNRDDPLTCPLLSVEQRGVSFGDGLPDLAAFGLIQERDECFLARGRDRLLGCSEMKLHGTHNYLNALAALAMGESLGLPLDPMLAVIRSFAGVPHRCQWVASLDSVDYFNDSKATNVGATLAALRGLSKRPGDVVLIAGGVGKGADFAPLLGASEFLKLVILLGESAQEMAAVLEGQVTVVRAEDMRDAVELAAERAEATDLVLLAPACASFDMYESFEARGDDFIRLVRARQGGRR